MNLGNVIRNIRKDRGQTQNEFASICGITQTYLSQIERNQKEPNLSTLKEISSKLDIPLPILFFKSINDEDIHPNKIEVYNEVRKEIDSLIDGLYKV